MKENESKNPVTVGFYALGCPKNMVDSERMLAEIAQAGMIILSEPDEAEVVVINTCGFIAPAKAEAVEIIEHAIGRKAAGAVKKVIVAGCLPQRMQSELLKQVKGIDAIVGLGQRDNIAQIITQTIGSNKAAAFLAEDTGKILDDRTRLLITPPHYAYLRISEGCDHNCSFCTIPSIRGRFRSKPKKLILTEAAQLADAGVVELNIIAQDTTYYGKDQKVANGLAKLLKELEKIETAKWIRLMYLYPAGITEKLIDTIASSKKIVHYLDIPLQHINDKILKSMRRPDTKQRICTLIEKLRRTLPDAVLRTTLIVGLPGETKQSFEELLEFVRWAKFDCLGAFKYYPEQGTEAAKMTNQVPEKTKQQRLDELMLVQQKIAFEKNRQRIGTKLLCLVDSVDQTGPGRARFYGQAPDIDAVCTVENCAAKPGEFINTKVIAANDYDLIVEPV